MPDELPPDDQPAEPGDPTIPPTAPADPPKHRTIGDDLRARDEAKSASDASTAAAIEADAKAKSDRDALAAEVATFAADLKAIGRPLVVAVPGGFEITYSTVDADGKPGYSTESGVGADAAVPGE